MKSTFFSNLIFFIKLSKEIFYFFVFANVRTSKKLFFMFSTFVWKVKNATKKDQKFLFFFHSKK
jgi:hypothetical protein